MKFCILNVSLFLIIFAGMASAQSSDQTPEGTAPDQTQPGAVQPQKAAVQPTPEVVRSAQEKLADAGYHPGKADGRMGPMTRAAIRKYQSDQSLTKTGKLDESTLSHLNVGGNQTMKTAPTDLKNGTMAAGHDIKKGHPVAATKAMGKGVGRAGKAVGEGAKSDVANGANKIEKKKSDQDNSNQPQP